MQLFRTIVMIGLLVPSATLAQDGGEPIVLGYRFTVPSDALGKDRPVRVGLPSSFDPAQPYPVIYVLDAGQQ